MRRFGMKYVLREGDPDVPGGAAPVVPPAEPVVYDESIIPDELKGRDPAEIKLLLSQMPRIVKAQKQELDDMRIAMAGGTSPTVVHGAPVAPAPPVQTAEEKQKEFEELFETDPRAAISKFIADEYAPVLGNLESRIGDSDLARFKTGMPGFDDYEEDVKALLAQSGAPATPANIQGAYAMAVGRKEIERQAVLARAEANPIPVTPAPDPVALSSELSPLQDQVREQMGLSVEDYNKYAGDDPLALKIRT